MFWLYGIKENYFDVHKKVKTPSCYFEKNLNTPLSFALKKVFAPSHSAPAPLYSKFFKPPNQKHLILQILLETTFLK